MLAHPFVLDGRDIRLTVSVGIAQVFTETDTGGTAEALLRDADLAIYRAKERGRDRIELFDERLRLRAASRLEGETALRRAVELGEFVVHYQPVVDLGQGTVVGVEALVRWEDRIRGLVPPSEFIPMAEDTGLVNGIGAFVLDEACRQVAEWNRARGPHPPLTVSVNLSARQLDHAGLAESVMNTLQGTGLDPALLWLEITESTLMEDATSTLAVLQSLKALGVTLAVDDFGTGYSSLLYLRRFPVDVLKVDQSFVAGLGLSNEDTAIVTAVLRLAQALGLAAVAEGVETIEHARLLTTLGCEFAQGFHWSQPLPADELTRWLSSFRSGSLGQGSPPSGSTERIKPTLSFSAL